jgi:hypothetical protein
MSENEGQFELAESFDIDDGSLEGLAAEKIFSMGVEWAMFRKQLSLGTPFRTICLPENRTRLVSMAERRRRFVEDRQTACVGWTEIWVGDPISYQSPSPESK